MDSINQQQPEHNMEDLHGKEAQKRIKEMTEEASSCFFCTDMQSGSFTGRPMAIQKVDDEGNFWFLSSKDSHKNKEVSKDPKVQLLLQASQHSGFSQ
jgi:general stress protein 26